MVVKREKNDNDTHLFEAGDMMFDRLCEKEQGKSGRE